MRNWDVIEELLKYKANPHGIVLEPSFHFTFFETETLYLSAKDKLGKSCAGFLSDVKDQTRLQELIKKYANVQKPDRACPCFSGNPAATCHAVDQPYPLHFLCVCGTGILSCCPFPLPFSCLC